MTEIKWETTKARAVAFATMFLFGVSFITVAILHDQLAEAKLRHPDPYMEAGWFETMNSEGGTAVLWNPMTGESWALACPGPAKTSCEWDPIEFRGVAPPMTSGWYDCIATGQGTVFWQVHTGQSWILACPGAINTCDWEPLEVRPQ